MFFKVSAGLICLLVCSACAKIKQSASAPIVIAESGGDAGCFSNLGDRMKTYAEGRMSEAGVRAFWSCASHNLAQYRSYTIGDEPGGAYSAGALRIFIQTYFMPGETLSDASLKGFMGVKRVLLGGDETLVTQAQFDGLQNLFNSLEELSLELRVHMGTLTQHHAATIDEIRAANRAATDVMIKFAQNLKTQNQTYTFAELNQFLSAFQANLTDESGSFGKLSRLLKLIPPLKTILISGSDSQISGEEWVPLFKGGALAIKTWTYLAQGLISSNTETSASSPLLSRAGLALAELVDSARARRPDQAISLNEFLAVFNVVAQNPAWPKNVHPDDILKLGRWGLKRLLGGDGSDQINARVVGNWQSKMRAWKALAGGGADATFDALWAEAPLPQWDDLGRMIFTHAPAAVDESRPHRVWSYLAMQWLFQSYGANDAATQAQVDQAVGEILPLLKNFGWLSSTTVAIGKKLVHEADLFTPAGNGDGKLQLGEGMRFLNMLVSSLRSAQVWIYDAPACAPALLGSCVSTAALVQQREILSPMSAWPSDLFTTPVFSAYFQRAGLTALSLDPAQTQLGLGDLLQIWQVFAYVEVFFQRFDVDHSGGIGFGESLPAMKIFGSTALGLLFGWNSPENFTPLPGSNARVQSTPKRPFFRLEASRQDLMHLLETFADL